HVERTNTAPHWRRQRSFDRHAKVPRRFYRVVRQPLLECVKRLFACEYFEPRHAPLPAVRLLYRCVKYTVGSFPDVAPGSVPLDVRNNRILRHLQEAIRVANRLSLRRYCQPVVRRLHSWSPVAPCLQAGILLVLRSGGNETPSFA